MNTFLKTITFFLSIIPLMLTSISAQNEIDALRFSELDWQGTARFMGAGKAFGAVGADFSALNTNPASIGLYKKSEITFTPMTLSIAKNTSGYNKASSFGQSVKYNVGSVGLIFAMPGISSTLWKKFQIGFGYNRIQNYGRAFSIKSRNEGSTIGSVIAEAANELGLDYTTNMKNWPTEIYYAYNSWLISPLTNTTYEAEMENIDMEQFSTVTRVGGNDEMVFSFGTNYDDMLFLGATIGVPFINFSENRIYTETNDRNPDKKFKNIKIEDELSVRATGINLKLGINYQPFDFLRVGMAFHTPTYYGNVRDFFGRQMTARAWQWEEDNEGNLYKVNYDVEPQGPYSTNKFLYSLTTPLRAMANVAFLIQQRAFISMEYEFVDYSMANMYSLTHNFNEENTEILNTYGFSHIARIGAEFNLTQVFSIRAGYNYISSPYKDDINDGSKHYASAGLGFRTRVFYSDFAYAFMTSKEKYWMFDQDFVNAVNNKFITHRIVLTIGVRF